jgi:NAD(P)-dependent dehydrogenase (short-subunit alcohol dehydrogenase family)
MPRTSKAAGSVALVTGANRGIGLAFVRELAARGAKKIYAGTRHPGDLGDEFAGLPAEVVPLDVTDLASVRAAAHTCPDVNLLVNNAGLFTNKRLVLTDHPAAGRREMEVNYFGVLNMTRVPSLEGVQERAAERATWAAIIGLEPPVPTADGAEIAFTRRTIRFVPPTAGRTGIVAVDVHATDRTNIAGQQGHLCNTLIRFV